MVTALIAIAAFLISVTLLVTVHEFGHYYVARLCGVKVLRFSIGFGKRLVGRRTKSGTEFVISALPLGGYVKMLDEREGEVKEEDKPYAFNRKPLWQRFLIVLAGPAVNLLVAVLFFWLILISGVTKVAPIIGEVAPQSPAAVAGMQSGQEILQVAGKVTPGWSDVYRELLRYMGDKRDIAITTKPWPTGDKATHQLPLKNWKVDSARPQLLKSLGITPYMPQGPLLVKAVVAKGAAAKAGVKPGDIILGVNGQTHEHLGKLLIFLRAHPHERITLDLKRGDETLTLPATLDEDKQGQGHLGVQLVPPPWPKDMVRQVRYTPGSAIPKAFSQTWRMSILTLQMMGKMIVGMISVKTVSGPIGIAVIAGQSISLGWMAFANFLALISLTLGIINLLPIPMLDGGHLMYYCIEFIRGKPVSERTQAIGYRFGLVFLVGLLLLAVYNDLWRLL